MSNQVAFKTLRAFNFTMMSVDCCVHTCDIISLMNATEQLAATTGVHPCSQKLLPDFPHLCPFLTSKSFPKGGGQRKRDDETCFKRMKRPRIPPGML